MGKDYIRFLGTGGARFVVSRQLRSSGGLWCSFNDTTICIDPGPGTLARCFSGDVKANPEDLDAVILSHRHLDHTTDANVMVEAMTRGALMKRGVLFAPQDALEGEPVVFSYLRQAVGQVAVLREGGTYHIGDISFTCPVRHVHGVETYGLKFKTPGGSIAFIMDTLFFPQLASHYQADLLVLNVVLYKHPGYQRIKHLDIEAAEKIIRSIQPRKAIITHFGTSMLDKDPVELAKKLSKCTGVPVLAAYDDMHVDVDGLFS